MPQLLSHCQNKKRRICRLRQGARKGWPTWWFEGTTQAIEATSPGHWHNPNAIGLLHQSLYTYESQLLILWLLIGAEAQ
jgi:hypothetical protein